MMNIYLIKLCKILYKCVLGVRIYEHKFQVGRNLAQRSRDLVRWNKILNRKAADLSIPERVT